jgi:hypothetical protein
MSTRVIRAEVVGMLVGGEADIQYRIVDIDSQAVDA